MASPVMRLTLIGVGLAMLTACGTRQVQDSLAGATAQQLVTHSIDDLVQHLPDADFAPYAGKPVHLTTHFLHNPEIRYYADRRLGVELARRFDMQLVDDPDEAEVRIEVFYTALGTDQTNRGFVLPLGFVPGLDQNTQIDLLTLDQFHGVAEMYYFVGPAGHERRGEVLQARTRTDSIGLPIISIPVSSIDRRGEGGD